MDGVGQCGAIQCHSADRHSTYCLGFSVALAPEPYHRTKVVQLTHLYELVNAVGVPLAVRQDDAPGTELAVVAPGETVRLTRWHRASRARPEEAPLLQVRPLEGAFQTWSPAFRITTEGTCDLRVYDAAGAAHQPLRVRVGQRGSVFVVALSVPPGPTFTVVNHSLCTVLVRQTGARRWDTVPGFRTLPFHWTDPEGPKLMQLLNIGDREEIDEQVLRRGGGGGCGDVF